jgi:DNA-binding response OmpR family regulator
MNPHILFVDDEAALCELLSLYLRSKGFDVTAALTAREARTLVEETSFDLAILDLNLGAEDGLELLGFIKGKCPQLPVVIFTGLDADEALIRSALAGRASGFVRKAQSLESLAAEVRRHLATPQKAVAQAA